MEAVPGWVWIVGFAVPLALGCGVLVDSEIRYWRRARERRERR